MTTAIQALNEAKVAWVSNRTISDPRYAQKQIQGLYHLILENRDDIVAGITEDFQVSTLAAEKELALFFQDLCRHQSNLVLNSKSSVSPASQAPPVGVCLILSHSASPIRFALGAIMAAFAAGNIVVLAGYGQRNSTFVKMQRMKDRYMDGQAFHVLAHVQLEELPVETADQVVLLADDENVNRGLLSQSPLAIHATTAGESLLVVGDGSKDWDKIARCVLDHTGSSTLSDPLNAVFIRLEDISPFMDSLAMLMGRRQPVEKPPGTASKPIYLDTVNGIVITPPIELRTMVRRCSGVTSALNDHLSEAQKSRSLLIVTYESLEQIIDASSSIKHPLRQLVYLAPESEMVPAYLSRFVKTFAFCLGHISATIPPAFPFSVYTSGSRKTLFPITAFSRPCVYLGDQESTSSSSRWLQSTSIATVRATYQDLVKPLEPDSSGQRLSIFDKVRYTVWTAGSLATLATFGAVAWSFMRRGSALTNV